nr:uncharacterized protein LOC117218971 [Megalopta genalis]
MLLNSNNLSKASYPNCFRSSHQSLSRTSCRFLHADRNTASKSKTVGSVCPSKPRIPSATRRIVIRVESTISSGHLRHGPLVPEEKTRRFLLRRRYGHPRDWTHSRRRFSRHPRPPPFDRFRRNDRERARIGRGFRRLPRQRRPAAEYSANREALWYNDGTRLAAVFDTAALIVDASIRRALDSFYSKPGGIKTKRVVSRIENSENFAVDERCHLRVGLAHRIALSKTLKSLVYQKLIDLCRFARSPKCLVPLQKVPYRNVSGRVLRKNRNVVSARPRNNPLVPFEPLDALSGSSRTIQKSPFAKDRSTSRADSNLPARSLETCFVHPMDKSPRAARK